MYQITDQNVASSSAPAEKSYSSKELAAAMRLHRLLFYGFKIALRVQFIDTILQFNRELCGSEYNCHWFKIIF